MGLQWPKSKRPDAFRRIPHSRHGMTHLHFHFHHESAALGGCTPDFWTKTNPRNHTHKHMVGNVTRRIHFGSWRLLGKIYHSTVGVIKSPPFPGYKMSLLFELFDLNFTEIEVLFFITHYQKRDYARLSLPLTPNKALRGEYLSVHRSQSQWTIYLMTLLS